MYSSYTRICVDVEFVEMEIALAVDSAAMYNNRNRAVSSLLIVQYNKSAA